MSPAARAKNVAAQKARWAEWKVARKWPNRAVEVMSHNIYFFDQKILAPQPSQFFFALLDVKKFASSRSG